VKIFRCNLKKISGRYRRSWTKKEKEREKWITNLLEKFAIALEVGTFYIAPTIFLFLCPGFYWDEIYLTSVPPQAFLETYLGIDVSVWNLRILFILMHNNHTISTIFNASATSIVFRGQAGAGYYILYEKLL